MNRILSSVCAAVLLVGFAGCQAGGGCRGCKDGLLTNLFSSQGDCDTCQDGESCQDCDDGRGRRNARRGGGHFGGRGLNGRGGPYAAGPPSAGVTYPYYTTRGPRDFLATDPRGIGP